MSEYYVTVIMVSSKIPLQDIWAIHHRTTFFEGLLPLWEYMNHYLLIIPNDEMLQTRVLFLLNMAWQCSSMQHHAIIYRKVFTMRYYRRLHKGYIILNDEISSKGY